MNNLTRNKKQLSSGQREDLLKALRARFEKNMNRHKGLEWDLKAIRHGYCPIWL